ncbi:MAG: phosphotransferase family protein [Allosphingosinicella sp.]|uniref:phosphotransferase family protein n=1 Tax=Allosphingosinicella sp. TaxID=2823234 RepID=UPI0039502E57
MSGKLDPPHGLELVDFDRLGVWMDGQGLPPGPITGIEQLTGGSQNILVRFARGGRHYVLRRPPAFPTADGNETMRREARLLAALAGTPVPHPALIAGCPDEEILGAAFYLMEPVAGFNPAVGLPELHRSDPAIRHAMGLAMADGIAALASVDFTAVGLGDFGRLGRYLERQVARWRSHYDGYALHKGWPGPDSLPDLNAVADWLEARRPAAFTPGLMHGDFHLKNVMFRLEGPELAAIVDWELATVGDPLVDLGWLLATWPDPAEPLAEAQIVVEPWDGFPTAEELIARYAGRSGRDVSAAGWYHVFACYKLGILLEGTYARACAGKAPLEIGVRLHRNAVRLLKRAARAAEAQ